LQWKNFHNHTGFYSTWWKRTWCTEYYCNYFHPTP